MFLGTLQTTEAIKSILGLYQTSRGKLLRCQFPALHFSASLVKKDPGCSLCGQPLPRPCQTDTFFCV